MIGSMTEELKLKIKQAKVVSFDLYDTLLYRKLGGSQEVFNLLSYCIDDPEFTKKRKRMRILASRAVNKMNGSPHATLHEIYHYWKCQTIYQKNCLSKNTAQQMKLEKLKLAEKLERYIELQTATVDNTVWEIYEYARKCKKRIILTSDMYLEQNMMLRILKRCQIYGWDALYLSSEEKKTKYDGTLYDEILEKEKLFPNELLHIGDNFFSDIKQASLREIRTYRYKKEEEKGAFWYDLGYQVGGPLYLGLCNWLEKHLKGEKLYCLSRDGYNLTKIWIDHNNCRKGKQIPQVEYVPSSRRALLLASITRLGDRELSLLPPYSCGQSIGQILQYLGFEDIPESELQKVGFSGYKDIIRTTCDIKRIRDVYRRNEKYILLACQREREALELYFEKRGLFASRVNFFDSGWNGTSQYLLEQIYQVLGKKSKIYFYYAGIHTNSRNRKKIFLKKGVHRAYLNTYANKKELTLFLKSTSVMELFFSEDAPAFHKYTPEGGEYESYEKRTYIQEINRGIIQFMLNNKELEKILPEKGIERYAVFKLAKLVGNPTKKEAKLIGDIKNVDSISQAQGIDKYLAKLSIQTLVRNPFLDIYWEQGVYRYPDNKQIVKTFVWLRQRFAWLLHTFG